MQSGTSNRGHFRPPIRPLLDHIRLAPSGPKHMQDANQNVCEANLLHRVPSDQQKHVMGQPKQEPKMPYYVVPVLYVPKRVVPPEEVQRQVSPPRLPFNSIKPPSKVPVSAPARLQFREESSLQHTVQHQSSSGTSSGHTSIYYFNQKLRSSSFVMDSILEAEHDRNVDENIGPTLDDIPPLRVRSKSAIGSLAETPRKELTVSRKKNQTLLNKKDPTLQDVRRRLVEALEMVEDFEKKNMRSIGTQYEDVALMENNIRRFDNLIRLEASLKKLRKHHGNRVVSR